MGTIRVSTAAGPREIRNVWKRTVNPFINKVRAAQAAQRRGQQLLSPGTDEEAPSSSLPSPPAPITPVPTPIPSPAPTPTAAQAPSHPTSAGASSVPAASSAAALARLERLRAAGAIDEATYQAESGRLR